MKPLLRAVMDESLQARVLSRRTLLYTSQAAPELLRPAHVRAASGIAWLDDRLAIIQDDASFIATIDPHTWSIDALALPAGVDGARLFDVERGNKKHKLDLEACTTVSRAGVATLLAFGSGSSPARENIVLAQHRHDVLQAEGTLRAELVDASRLYAVLRDHPTFATSELNIEGAVYLDDRVRLFQRSNGLSRSADGSGKACATCDLDWTELSAFLDAPASAAVPTLANVRHYDLGRVGDVAFTFTDATRLRDGTILFVASAEGSPNAIDDGVVVGTALGLIDRHGDARMCTLRDEHGHLVTDKAEGIALSRTSDDRAYVVFDPDDHNRPATLAEVALTVV